MILQEQKVDIVKGFFKHEIIKINTKTLFKLSSGIELPLYLDHRLIFSLPDLRKKVVQAWADMLKDKCADYFGQFNHESRENLVFSGTATAGIAPAYALSDFFESGFIYVRDKPKAHGLQAKFEGVATAQNQFIVVDDMVVTGNSLLKNVAFLQEQFGCERMVCATSISCHESPRMRQTFVNQKVSFFPLFTTYEIFNIAHEHGVIDTQTFQTMMEFLEIFNQKI
jgi:orotate phosphoribosyltransferase